MRVHDERRSTGRILLIALLAGSATAFFLAFFLFTWHLGGHLGGGRSTDDEAPRRSVLPVPVTNVSGLAFDGEALWITPEGAGTIHRVDPASGAILASLPFPIAETGGSAWDGSHLWQLAYLEKQIYRLDVQSGAIVATLPAPGSGICSGMTYDGRHLWLANTDDEKLYRVDPASGEVVTAIDSDFETTGLAWDGAHLWNGVLVGSPLEHGGATPYTGFVQERDLATGATRRVLPVQGVFAGTSDWTPGSGRARRLWWFDGYHQQLVQFTWNEPTEDPLRWISLILACSNLAAAGLVWRSGGDRPPATSPRAS